MSQTEGNHSGEFALGCWEALSRDNETLLSGENVVAGQVLGRVDLGTASAAAFVGTGDGTIGAVTVSAGAKVGIYSVEITKAATNAGDFQVIDPDGFVVGLGTVAVAFSNGGLAFTVADGDADYAVGDISLITVIAGSGKFVAHDAADTLGSQNAVAIAFADTDASTADALLAVVARNQEVDGGLLIWKTGISAADKAAGIASLAALNIIVR